LHVEQLQGGNRIATAMLPVQARSQIDSTLQGVSGAEAFLERTSQVLAVLSSGVGVAMAMNREGDVLEHVHFQRLAQRRVLAVMVSRGGVVRDRVLLMADDVSGDDLDAASRYLNEQFRGWTIDGVRAEIVRRAETERSEYKRMRQAAEELWTAATAGGVTREQTVFVDGVSNLIDNGYDRGRLREMLAALETKERVIALLHAYMGTEALLQTALGSATEGRVRVVFDMEVHTPEMQGLVLVAAPVISDGAQHGAVGVIGTQRMHYENTINAVQYVAQLFAESQAAR
jgi:heat-inducible transcriptional repressor